MTRFEEAFWGVFCALAIIGCSSSEFSSAPAGLGGSGPDGGAGTAGTAGTAGGPQCRGPADCNDRDPCTDDACGANGTCAVPSPHCARTEKCCGGACAECCGDTDCADGNDCTADQCSSGKCAHTPDDTRCSETEYCSVTQGCKPREVCTQTGACADQSDCTTDRCTDGLCFHDYCATGTVCCPDGDCAECCNDSQCTSPDACHEGSCVAGHCQVVERCPGKKCCDNGQGSASCGACCSAAECDDGVSCTDDACAAGSCSHTPNSSKCGSNQTCDPVRGCVQTAECSQASDCRQVECQTAKCESGRCTYTGCPTNLRCCPGAGCQACCQNSDCSDGVSCTDDVCSGGTCTFTPNDANCSSSGTGSDTGARCDPELGCVQCTKDTECDDNNLCTSDSCVDNRCVSLGIACPVGRFCCPNTGICGYCCNDCDCVFSADTQEAIPPPPLCGVCVQGACQASQFCTC